MGGLNPACAWRAKSDHFYSLTINPMGTGLFHFFFFFFLLNRYSLSLKPFNNTIEYPEDPVFKTVDKIQNDKKNDKISF